MDDKPNAVIVHVGTNDILTNANREEIARNIIKISLNCKNYGANDVVISSTLVKKTLGYQFPPLRRDRNSKGDGKWFLFEILLQSK